MKAIDYRLRPAKHVVRKLLAEAFQRLDHLAPLSDYQYVGFGGLFYADFVLFHRLLGFGDMVSIEKDSNEQSRYQKNRPFQAVDLRFGFAGDELPKLSWKSPAIVWLDGTRRLDEAALRDISFLAGVLPPRSLLIITLNVGGMRSIKSQPVENPGEAELLDTEVDLEDMDDLELASLEGEAPPPPQGPLDLLRREVGSDRVPSGLTDAGLGSTWGYADASFQIAEAEISDTLARRCSGDADPIASKTFVNLRYEDDAKMLVAGWLLSRESDFDAVEACRLDTLPTMDDGAPRQIRVPLLTFKEHQALDALLPKSSVREMEKHVGISQAQIEQYRLIYRYYPALSQVDVL